MASSGSPHFFLKAVILNFLFSCLLALSSPALVGPPAPTPKPVPPSSSPPSPTPSKPSNNSAPSSDPTDYLPIPQNGGGAGHDYSHPPQFPGVTYNGGGGGSYPPLTPFYSPKPPVVEPPRPRPYIFYTRFEKIYRTKGTPVNSLPTLAVTGMTDPILTLDTLKREAEEDNLKSEYEYQHDKMLVGIEERLHELVSKNYSSGAVGLEEFKESETKLLKAQWRTEESRERAEEYATEVTVLDIKLAEVKGLHMPLTELAKAFAHLWEVRLLKAQAAEMQAAASYQFLNFSYGLRVKLKSKEIISQEELIKSERDEQQGLIVWNLARAIVEKNKRNFEEAKANLELTEKPPTPPSRQR